MGWMWSRGGKFASVILGPVAGDPVWPPGRSSSLSLQLRPRVFSAHRPVLQLQVQDSVMGWQPILWQSLFRPEQASFTAARLARWRSIAYI